MTYPIGYGRCIMCGADQNQHCTVISTAHDEFYDQDAGDTRLDPHAARARIGVNEPAAGFVAVKDEPNHYRGQPHTAQCGTDCPL